MTSELTVTPDITLAPTLSAASFLRTEADCMRKALAAAHNGAVVAVAAGRHNRSHGRWLALIAWARDHADEHATSILSDLYVFHGQMLSSLERRTMNLLDQEVARQARTVLTERLDELTAAAVTVCSDLSITTPVPSPSR